MRADTWRQDAACVGADPSWWFPEPGQPATPALNVCHVCPVREACAEHAITRPEPDGIWGGLTEAQREQERRTRARHRRILNEWDRLHAELITERTAAMQGAR